MSTSNDDDISVGAVQTPQPKKFARSPTQRRGDRRRKAESLIAESKALVQNAKELKADERKCRGKVKLRDEAGEYLRDSDGKVLTRECRKAPIKGGMVCPSHGGKAPNVRAKANRRLLAMVEPSIVRLESLIHQEEHLPTALGAIKEVLNRAGGAVIGPIDPTAGKTDTRPIINVGIQVGGIDPTKKLPDVKVGLITPGQITSAEAEVDGEVEDDE